MLRKPHKLRVILLGGLFVVLGSMVGARLYHLQVVRGPEFGERAQRQQTKRLVIQPERGDILDRHGRPLATSTGSLSVYVNTRYLHETAQPVPTELLARQASHHTRESVERVQARLNRGGVVALGRQMHPDAAQRIVSLIENHRVDGRGYWYHRESKRLYPRNLAPHVIGFCATDGDGDNDGLEGLEARYNAELSGSRVEGETRRTAISQVLDPVGYDQLAAAQGNTLVLTLDAAIQEAAEKAVDWAAWEFDADAAGAIVQDVHTGEILAMVSWPSYDNSNHGRSEADTRRNRTLTDPIETGSVAKLFTAAVLLDLGIVDVDTMIDCEGGRAVIDRRRITDSGSVKLGVAPFYEIIRHSSNVGIIKAAQALENQEWYDYLRAFGFGQPTGIDLPGEGGGILYNPSRWTRLTRSSLPMGYEMALTPIQIVNALSALANGGELLRPHVVREIRDSRGGIVWQAEREVVQRVIRPGTSAMMLMLMEDVVANGSGRRARIPGFRAGGKTGTTRKSHILDRREYIASFGGVFPTDQPRVAIYTWVDNPKGKYYASEVAAPVFREIAIETVLQLGLVPMGNEQVADAHDFTDWDAESPLWHDGSWYTDTRMSLTGTVMPDLRGLSMSEVRERLPHRAGRVRFLGSGRVADQHPEAGASIGSDSDLILVFSPDTTRTSRTTRPAIAHSDRSPQQ